VLLEGIATGPARERTIKKKNGTTVTVYEIAVLDNDGGIVTVTTWAGKNLWPDAKVGQPVKGRVTRARMYQGQTQVSVAGEATAE
jgi:hypothetical protein